MATNQTYTYEQAKGVFESAPLKEDIIIKVDKLNVHIFRKHLSELIKRKQSPKRFTSRLLKNNQLKVIRIE